MAADPRQLARDPDFQALPPADQQAMLAELGAAPARSAADDALVRAVIHVESGGNPLAVSRVGARGLMQLMPATARELGVDPTDPVQNVEGGRRYLSQLLGKYGDQDTALMAYNWGPGRVDRWIAGGRKGPVPAETLNYVSRVNAQLGGDAPAQAPGFLERALSALDPIGTASAATLDEPKRGGQPDAREIVGSPEFQALPASDQAQILAELDPDFAALPPADRDAFLVELKGGAPAPAGDGAGFSWPGVANLGERAWRGVQEGTDTVFRHVEAIESGSPTPRAQRPLDGPDTIPGAVAEGLGNAAAMTPEVIAGASIGGALGGPVGAMLGGAGTMGLQAAFDAPEGERLEAFKDNAALGVLLGKLAPVLEPYSKAVKAAVVGTIFGGSSALHGSSAEQVTTDTILGGVLGTVPGGKRKEAPRERVAAMVERQSARAETAQRDTATLLGATPGEPVPSPEVLARAAARRATPAPPAIEAPPKAQPSAAPPPEPPPPAAPPPADGAPPPVEPPPPPTTPDTRPPGRAPEGSEGRGFGVSVSDRTPKWEHSARVLGEESEAFVRSFLEDPKNGPALEARRRGVLTGAKVDELAERVGLTVADYKRMAQGSVLPVEVQTHLANLIHSHKEVLKETTAHLEAARRTHDVAEAYRAEASIDELGHNMARLMMTLEASRSEAGRTLGSNRLQKTKAESLAMKSLRMVMDETTLPENVRQRLAARIAAAGDNSKAVIDAVREAYLPSWWDKLIEFRVNALLSSPLTVIRNITGNSIATATRLTENVTGVALDLAYEGGARAIGRKGAQQQHARVASEIAWDVYGTLMGSVEGLREARRAFVDESYGAARGRVGEEALRLPAISGRPGEFVRLSSRVQSAADLFFYHQNATGRRYQLAARQAVHEGNTGPALRARIDQLARQAGAVEERLMARIAKGEIKPKNDAERIAGSAHAYGEEFTFRNKLGAFASRIDAARNADTVAGHAAKTVIPFFRTPINISKFASQRSVLGFVSPRNWSDIVKSGNRDVIVSSVARMAIGAGTAAALTNLALGGYISGSGPKDRAAREALERTGWQPYSVRIGDTWYSYRGLSPASEQLAMAAEMGETIMASKRGEGVDLGTFGRVGLSIAKTNLDQPMWTGATDLIDAVRDSDTEWGERNLGGRVANLASTYIVPRGAAFVARAGDPTRRAFPEDLSSMIEQGVPGLREKTLPWRDALGRGYESPSAALQSFVPHRSDQPASRLDAWLFSLQDSPERAVIPYPDRTQLGRRLSPEDYDRLQIARGELLVPALEGLRPKLEGKDRLVGQKAIGELVPTMTRAAVDRVIPDAELRALELEPSDAGRRAVLAVMHEPLVREVYSMPDRTEDEKRQILELVSKAPTDPRAQAALKALVLSRGGGGSPEGP